MAITLGSDPSIQGSNPCGPASLSRCDEKVYMSVLETDARNERAGSSPVNGTNLKNAL